MTNHSAHLQQIISERRSIYALGKALSVSPQTVIDVAKRTLLNTPSAFNSQTTRLVILFDEHHHKLWDITQAQLMQLAPTADFARIKQRMDSLCAAAGTVLFYEDQAAIEAVQKAFALYADGMPNWSQHTSAMHQYVLWLELTALGIGANLQHYNPLIDSEVAHEFDIPA
ncbi:nitroreductase family protein [Spirabiliibacterium falconis]|uniref:nitroreductase family protein n=1 Tax=Spirabiliibacterium falconis TaxID=572023 RepID=UPI001AACDF06|nr:nitroreductase family protein [Spirabiliibacterium falconis]